MFGYLVTVVAAFAAIKLIYLIRSMLAMRKVDRISAVIDFGSKSGLFKILEALGVDARPPKVTSSDFKLTLKGSDAFDTLDEVFKLNIRDDDVFIATFPKSGTTWMQEIVWLICNDVNLEEAKKSPISKRSPFMEIVDVPYSDNCGLQSVENWPNHIQRLIKTHLPFEFLPKDMWKGEKRKLIYVARNPKDVCVSYYFYTLAFPRMPHPGTFEEFFEKFCRGKVVFGSWFSHCLKYWKESKQRSTEIHFVTYEAMKKNLKGEIKSLTKFLGKDLSESKINAIEQHCGFASMSKNPMANMSQLEYAGYNSKTSSFMRKGEVGDWKNYFTIGQSLFFDEIYQEKMKDTDLVVEFE